MKQRYTVIAELALLLVFTSGLLSIVSLVLWFAKDLS
ncbi:hypothetical protein AZ012_004695 [Citrobacter amalonaticus]|nr:hypothetical protein AZ012_004695 [Citrobacter amalonaticus]